MRRSEARRRTAGTGPWYGVRRGACLSLAVLFALSGIGSAREEGDADELDVIVVTATRLETLLEAVGEADIRWTEGPGHAAELAREAISEGASRVVAAGGDGTVSEIASTLAAAPEGAALGILTAFYGVAIGYLICLPIQTKLERLLEKLQAA